MEGILMLTRSGEGYYEEKRSRFLALAFPVNSEEDAQKLLNARRKEHPEARHHCYAYMIGERNELTRFSDDGEPSGTGGRPILDVLQGSGLHNALVVVTRYFGGTLLGTGGLSRAYSAAAADALSNCGSGTLQKGSTWDLIMKYSDYARVERSLQQQGIPRMADSFTDAVCLTLFLLPEQEEAFASLMADLTAGSALLNKVQEVVALREEDKPSVQLIENPFSKII